jgi:2-keto-3-deoxy-L-rhamnonate aldolase RhmA
MLRKNELFYNEAKHRLRNKEKLLGAWLQTASPYAAEIFAKAGLDVLVIDMEHGPGDILNLIEQLRAIGHFGSVPFVRAPWNDMVTLKRILDAGVYGVLVPYVNTAEEARSAVEFCKYPLLGKRGVAPSPRAPGFNMYSMNYLTRANDEILVMTAIETAIAVENIDQILEVENLDGVFIGPMDLATSMGHFCDPSHPNVKKSIEYIEQKVKKSDKFLASVAGNMDIAFEKFDKGYNLILAMADGGILGSTACSNVERFAAYLKDS